MSEYLTVQFVKPFGVYQPKDRAGFPKSRAEAMIKAGVAKMAYKQTVSKKSEKKD